MVEKTLGQELQKKTWGSAEPLVRRAPTVDSSQAPQPPQAGETTTAPVSKRGRGGGRGRSCGGAVGDQENHGAQIAPIVAAEPEKEESGAGLLSRLLSKNADVPSASKPFDLFSSVSSFQTLNASNDIFSYLHRKDDQPYNALDMDPPLGSTDIAGSTADVRDADADASEEVGYVKSRGRGRGQGRGRCKPSLAEDFKVESTSAAPETTTTTGDAAAEVLGSPQQENTLQPQKRRRVKTASPLKDLSNCS